MILNVMIIIVGMLADGGSAIMLCIPILLPVVVQLGVSPIHFASILGVNHGRGLVTPPCARMLYFAAQIGKVHIKETLVPTFRLILFAWVPTLILITFVSEISTALPRVVLGGRF